MGGRRPTLPHAELAAVIKANNVRDDYFLSELQQQEPVYQTLFELIALCRKRTPHKNPEAGSAPPQTFDALEQVLLKLYAGTATPDEAGQILSGLRTSPSFYRRLLAKLEALTPHVAWEEMKTLEGVSIKSEEEVLQLVRGAVDQIEAKESAGEQAWRAMSNVTRETFHASVQVLDFITGHRMVAVGLPLVLIASFTLFQFGLSSPYEKSAPYPPPSNLRGSLTFQAKDSGYYQFKDSFAQAMSDYVLRDYTNTLKKLESLQPRAESLHSNLADENYASLLRDYYFYTGVSHLALSRKKSFFSKKPGQHAELAVRWLARADSLAQAGGKPGSDRETYFLGLAYGFNGQKGQAASELKKIRSNSSFHQQSLVRIKEWSNL